MTHALELPWRYLPGNKYTRKLDSAMDSKAGYVILQRVRKKGQARGEMCNVIYDRDYLIEVLIRKVISPLSSLGKERVIELVSIAWDLYEKNPLTAVLDSNSES